jgi:predicted nucleic acid-binding protein
MTRAMNAVFDTNILIDYLNGIPEAKVELALYSRKSISIITWIEVMAGTNASDADDTRLELLNYERLPITLPVAERSFLLRRDHRLKMPDAIILATAQEAGVLLVTRNTREFDSSDPQIRIPYKL